jgi:hypothetical protein
VRFDQSIRESIVVAVPNALITALYAWAVEKLRAAAATSPDCVDPPRTAVFAPNLLAELWCP